MKIELKKINDHIPVSDFIFLLGLGFDERSLSILESICIDNAIEIIGIHNGSWPQHAEKNVEKFLSLASSKGILIDNSEAGILKIADALYERLQNLTTSHPNCHYLVDVTGFSHELLVILIGILNNQNLLAKVRLLYTGAENYSTNTEAGFEWLSRGVVEIRSILGFPGQLLPSKKLHLVVMAGFEVERAAEVIARYEPALISIGHGGKSQSVSSKHHDFNLKSNKKIIDLVQAMRGDSCPISEFSFSCIDPIDAKNQILGHLKNYPDYNTIICPLNTKLSTVGAALSAIENQSIQLCYPQVMEYNIDGYASKGNQATIIEKLI